MWKLNEIRTRFPEYNDLTDYELATAMYQTHHAAMSYEQFAQQFGGPLQEDPNHVAARDYNQRHPTTPIKAADIGQGSYANDMGHALAAGINGLAALPFWGLEKGSEAMGWNGMANTFHDARTYFQDSAEAKRQGYSADMKMAAEKEFITEDEKGYGLGTAWGDSRAVGGMVAESLPSMVGGMGIGAGIASGLVKAGLSRKLAWALGSSLGEGSVSGAQSSLSVHDAVMAMPEETLDSPEYQELLQSMPPVEARKELANRLSLAAGTQTGLATAALSAPAGAMFGKMLGGETGKTLLRSMGKQAGLEALEEAPQSGSEHYLSQRQLQRADAGIDPMRGVANAAVAGGIAGGIMGGGMGGFGHAAGTRMRERADALSDNHDATETERADSVAPLALPSEIRLALPEAPIRMGTSHTGHGSLPMNGRPQDTPDEFLSDAEATDIADFVRKYEANEQMQGNATQIAEYGRPAGRSTTQLALAKGDTVDLLAVPQTAGIVQSIGGIAAFPTGTGAMPMGTNSTGRPAITSPTEFSTPTIATPYTPRPALPQQSGPSAGQEVWGGGRSQLAYDGGMMQGLGFIAPASTPSPISTAVTPPAMPTANQINNTQAPPRADTMESAAALGMPAPNLMSSPPLPTSAMPAPVNIGMAAPALGLSTPMLADVQPNRGIHNETSPRLESRLELLQQLPRESHNTARRMPHDQLREYVRAVQNPVPFLADTVAYTQEDNPMPTAPTGTVFTSASGRALVPFPQVDYASPRKHKSSNAKVAHWLLDEARKESTDNSWQTLLMNGMKADNLSPADVRHLVDVLSEGTGPEERSMLKPMAESATPAHAPSHKPSKSKESLVESQKTEEDTHGRVRSRKPGKQSVVDEPLDLASGHVPSLDDGTLEQPQPRGTAEPSGQDGGAGDVSGRHDGRDATRREGRTVERSAVPDGSGRAGGRRERDTGKNTDDDLELGGDTRTSEQSGRGRKVGHNHRIAETDVLVPGGAAARAKANIAAIRLVRMLEREGRAATPDEKKTLTQFTGWGSLAQTVFNPDFVAYAKLEGRGGSLPSYFHQDSVAKYRKWKSQYGEALHPALGGMLSESEWDAAEKSTLNAHYTDRTVISAMWEMAEKLGFHGGRILEPSAGTGLFFGLMPDHIAQNSSLMGVELDEVTGKILQYLYADADIQITGFERAKRLGDNTVDLVISNVPFGDFTVFDKARPQYNTQSIHNYFFSRALDAVRPGGLVMQISSRYTLDSGSAAKLREDWGRKADLVAAVRLPGTAFEKNAGTEVTTDIIIFRKKSSRFDLGQSFRNLVSVETEQGDVRVNEYFWAHSEMVLGTHSLKGSMYGGNEYTLLPSSNELLEAGLQRIIAHIPANIYGVDNAMTQERTASVGHVAHDGVKEGTLVVDDGKLYLVADGRLEAPAWGNNKRQAEQAKAYLDIKDVVLRLISSMNTDADDQRVSALRKELNSTYDAYTKRYGNINKRGNTFLEDDMEFPTIAALENVSQEPVDTVVKSGPNKGKIRKNMANVITKADIFSKRTIFPFHSPEHADSPEDALKISRIYKNGIDLPYIAKLLGMDVVNAKTVLLKTGEVFEAPETGLLEPRDMYLSGNVKEKLERAERAAVESPAYEENISALREVQPARIGIEAIFARIGSAWMPPEVYGAFLRHIGVNSAKVTLTRLPGDEGSSTWSVQGAGLSGEARNRWGTERVDLLSLVEDCLNLKRTVVMDFVKGGLTASYVRNDAETMAAQEKQRLLQEEFSAWLVGNEENAKLAEDTYNTRFNGFVVRTFDVPGIKHYPNASRSIELRDNQKVGVARALQESCLLAHGVGSGKTMLQITLAMEMRRLGTARKPWIVVQGSTLSQFASSFKALYPGARILAPTEKQRTAKNRRRLLAQIVSGDWDAVITPHGFFNGVSVSPATEESFIREQVDEYEDLLHGIDKLDKATRKQIEKKIERLKVRLEALANIRKDENIFFDELGIDALIIDEAHAYKRGQFVTKMDNVKGLDRDSSQRSLQMLMKARLVQEKTGGKNVIMSTGTPISNTLTEMWTMFRYTRPDLLRDFGVEQFDDFATAFATTSITQEETATGEWKDVERFNTYVNGPELLTLWRLGADVAITEDLSSIKGLPSLLGGKIHEIAIERSESLSNYIEALRQERIEWDRLSGSEKKARSAVPLQIYNRAKQAAIDLRLVDSTLPDEIGSKVNTAVRNIVERWAVNHDNQATQIVFSDTFQSKDKGFNLFKDIKQKLIKQGIPQSEIAIIHDFKTDISRQKLFDAVNRGEIRVLMGTTEKLGVGVNVQERLLTAHHLDAPKRPMDFEQRNGRIRRPGNIFSEVEILTYGTKNTLDSVTFQQLISKQKFINQLLRGNVADRSFENPFDSTQATFEDMMAAFSGNPLAKEKMQLTAEVRRLQAMRTAHNAQVTGQRHKQRNLKGALERQEAQRSKDKSLTEYVERHFSGGNIAGKKEITKAIEDWLNTADTMVLDSVSDIRTQAQWYTKNRKALIQSRSFELGHGLNVKITVEPLIDFPDGTPERSTQNVYRLEGPHDIHHEGSFNGGQGLLTRISNALGGFAKAYAISEARIQDTHSQIAILDEEVKRPFAQQQELETAEKRLEAVETELEATTKVQQDAGSAGTIEGDSELFASLRPGEFLPSRKAAKAGVVPLKAAGLRDMVDELSRRAAKAARTETVQSFDGLPERLQAAYGDNAGALEGVYDPGTGTVWLVADNLVSRERAADVWAHEQFVHHGLRGMLSDDERIRLLNRLWLAVGGMRNEGIREVAARYGVDTRGDAEARQQVMEEYLASLAEKKRNNLLSSGEVTLWRRFVAAIREAWGKTVLVVTGKSSVMDTAEVDKLLSALGRYVMTGVPHTVLSPNTTETLPDASPAFASVGEDKEAAGRVAWDRLRRDTAEWRRQLEEFVAQPKLSTSLLTVCQTPDVLKKLGAPVLPMSMTRQNLAKAMSSKSDHNLPVDLLKRLPSALAEPVMVFESATSPDSFVVLTDLRHEGRSVMAAVHLDTVRQRIHVNDIASAYKRNSEGWYLQQIEDGRLLYQDKQKSLAWARTARLQLPLVRRLPARLSGKKVLTEQDIVKPMNPTHDAPLASLSQSAKGSADGIRSALSSEGVATSVRTLRSIIGRGVSADVADLLSNPEMGKLVESKDMGMLERLFKLPHWIAKDHSTFAKVYDRQTRRVEERSSELKKSLEKVPLLYDPDPKKRLNKQEMNELRAMIWKWDGKPIDALNNVEKFFVEDTTLNGRDVLVSNPEYYPAFTAWLDTQPGSTRAKQAFLQVRMSLDADFLKAYSKMAAMSDLADTDLEMFRTTFGHASNYFPHRRTGKYFVTATVGDGVVGSPKTVVYRQHFDVPHGSSVREEWAKIVAAHKKEFPDAAWHRPREVEKLPDDILGAPIDADAMEQIIKNATAKLGDNAEEVQAVLLSGVSDILKARGFGSHGIARQNIPGFESDNILDILYSYKSGLNGWLTKMEAASDFVGALGKIDAKRTPHLWEYASQYIKDMMRNSDKIDRITGNMKSVAFAWYLGANLKTAVVNLTQNVLIGVPRLQQYVTGGGGMWLKSAMDSVGLHYSHIGVSGAKRLKEDELRLVQELFGDGVINDAYMEEVRGQLGNEPGARMWNHFIRLMGLPMSIVERFNRASLALAAYRAARSGALRQKACAELGVKPGTRMTYEQAKDFAAMLVRDTHYVLDKGNQPEFFRSSVAGRMLSPAYTFRSFAANTVNLYYRALRHEGMNGMAFVARSLGATVALGGLTAFPLYATMSALCQALSGDDDDWTESVRRKLPQNNLLRDVVCYGVPAFAGIGIGGSLRMETPMTEGFKKGATVEEVFQGSIGDIIGIPYDMLVSRPSKMLEAAGHGNYDRMVESMMPTFISNMMQAWRLHTEGQTTMMGRPINDPGKPGARTLSEGEAMGKMLGFQPLSSTKSYEAYAARGHGSNVRSAKIDDLAVLALKTVDTGDASGRREMNRKLREWNETMRAEGKAHMLITGKDVERRVKARRRENRVTPKSVQQQAWMSEVWG